MFELRLRFKISTSFVCTQCRQGIHGVAGQFVDIRDVREYHRHVDGCSGDIEEIGSSSTHHFLKDANVPTGGFIGEPVAH